MIGLFMQRKADWEKIIQTLFMRTYGKQGRMCLGVHLA